MTDTGAGIRYQLDHARRAACANVRPIGALTVGEKGEQLRRDWRHGHGGACAFSR